MSVIQATALTAHGAYAIGVEAYHYFYPTVSMEITRGIATNLPANARPAARPIIEADLQVA